MISSVSSLCRPGEWRASTKKWTGTAGALTGRQVSETAHTYIEIQTREATGVYGVFSGDLLDPTTTSRCTQGHVREAGS